MMLQNFAFPTALLMSIIVHIVCIVSWPGSLETFTPMVKASPSPSEIAAINAFEELDQKQSEMAKKAADADTEAKARAAEKLNESKIEPLPVAKVEKKPRTEQEQKETKTRTSTSDTPTKAASNGVETADAKAITNAAFQKFGSQVQRALAKVLRAPKNIENVRAIVALRFIEGRLSNVSINKSSGNALFDDAVLNAAKNAPYPKAPAGLSRDAVFHIPVRI